MKKLDELYFGVMLKDFNSKKMKQYNLFNFSRIKWSVARYRTMSKKERASIENPLMFCFSDVWSRCEYEMIISQFPFKDAQELYDTGEKVDIFTLYVEPNAKLLIEMVNNVSVSSCREYIKAERKRLRG